MIDFKQLVKEPHSQMGTLISLTLFICALWVLYRTLHTFDISDVMGHMFQHSPSKFIIAGVFTIASYFVVTGYDVVALAHIGRKIPYGRTAVTAFLASVFGNNLGFAILTGTSIRYRMYSIEGLSTLEITGVSSLCALSTILGMGTLFGISMIFQDPVLTDAVVPIPHALKALLGALVLAVIFGYTVYAAAGQVTLRIKSLSVPLPDSKTVLAQITLATVNLSLVGSLIYILIAPYNQQVGLFTFFGVFAIAVMAGSASNIPGGVGVFESVLLVGLPEIAPDALLGCILLFRCIYYLVPLGIAACLLAYKEISDFTKPPRILLNTVTDLLDHAGPSIMSIVTVFAGTVILFSYSVRNGYDYMSMKSFVPLFVLEIGHLVGICIGIGLIIVARGIFECADSASNYAIKFLGIGIVASLLKGFDYWVAGILSLILIIFWQLRTKFNQISKPVELKFTAEWIWLLAVIIMITIWIGFFEYKDISYTNSLWWTFSYNGEYSRYLRGIAAVLTIFYFVAKTRYVARITTADITEPN